MLSESLEAQSEHFAAAITGRAPEFWEEKHEAMMKLTKSVREYMGVDADIINEKFTTTFYKNLKEPLRVMISDLRSQQVREAANLLTALVEVSKDHIKTNPKPTFVGPGGTKTGTKTVLGGLWEGLGASWAPRGAEASNKSKKALQRPPRRPRMTPKLILSAKMVLFEAIVCLTF